MEQLTTSQLVKMDDLNHHGTLFVGKALMWLCETGFMTVSKNFGKPDELVFYAMNGFKFLRPVAKGDICTFTGTVVNAGKTSVSVYVKGESLKTKEIALEGFVTYVAIDPITRKRKAHNLVLEDTTDKEEQLLRERSREVIHC